jgi:hypothetical protein
MAHAHWRSRVLIDGDNLHNDGAPGAVVQRYDAAPLPSASLTPEGYLFAPATRVARVGVLEYVRTDGTKQSELRLPEELGDPASLASMHLKPLTREHPREGMVNALSWRDRAVGVVSTPRLEGDFAAADVMVTDGLAVEEVRRGDRSEVSLGYLARLEPVPGGVWRQDGHPLDGTPCDFVQRAVRYNHLALVKAGRANEGTEDRPVRIRLDDAGNQLPAEAGADTPEPSRLDQENDMAMAKMMIGESEFEVPAEVAAYIESLKGKAPKEDESPEEEHSAAMKLMAAEMAALKAKVSEMEAKADAYKRDAEGHAAKLDEMLKRAESAEGKLAGYESAKADEEALKQDSAQIEARANAEAERIALLQRVAAESKRALPELCRLDNAALRIEIVKARRPNLDLAGKSPDFVAGLLASIESEAPVGVRNDAASQIATTLYTPAPGTSASESPLVKVHRERAARAQ